MIVPILRDILSSKKQIEFNLERFIIFKKAYERHTKEPGYKILFSRKYWELQRSTKRRMPDKKLWDIHNKLDTTGYPQCFKHYTFTWICSFAATMIMLIYYPQGLILPENYKVE